MSFPLTIETVTPSFLLRERAGLAHLVVHLPPMLLPGSRLLLCWDRFDISSPILKFGGISFTFWWTGCRGEKIIFWPVFPAWQCQGWIHGCTDSGRPERIVFYFPFWPQFLADGSRSENWCSDISLQGQSWGLPQQFHQDSEVATPVFLATTSWYWRLFMGLLVQNHGMDFWSPPCPDKFLNHVAWELSQYQTV